MDVVLCSLVTLANCNDQVDDNASSERNRRSARAQQAKITALPGAGGAGGRRASCGVFPPFAPSKGGPRRKASTFVHELDRTDLDLDLEFDLEFELDHVSRKNSPLLTPFGRYATILEQQNLALNGKSSRARCSNRDGWSSAESRPVSLFCEVRPGARGM